MKLNETKIISYLIVIVPLVLVLSVSFFITSFYLNKVTNYFQTAKENSIKDYLNIKKNESEIWTQQLNLLFKYTNNRVEVLAKKELEIKVDKAYEVAHSIYNRYKYKKNKDQIKQMIKETLLCMTYNNEDGYIFITNYTGEGILHGTQIMDLKSLSSYLDADNRSIVLEEIQKVRKHSKGYLKSRISKEEEELIYVRDLKLFNWFIGSRVSIKDKREDAKNKLLEMIKSIPMKKDEFLLLYSLDKLVYSSKNVDINQKKYFSKLYFKPFKWNLIYGFDIKDIDIQAQNKQQKLDKMLDEEFEFIVKVSIFIVLFVVLLSLMLSLKINAIFRKYQDEVNSRNKDLQELNSSLEKRVQKEIETQRDKDKMLIQRSKMAEMGDMLSMIAHQWRQPLNQLTYILMNIESAYEYKELTKEYLDKKIKEGNKQLEYMSSTIDDFKNFFKPDKQKENVDVDNIIKSSISLVNSSLKAHEIDLELELNAQTKKTIYKNEFIQVIVNLIKNSKDVLVSNNIKNPTIKISSYLLDNKVIIEVCDNGGGIDKNIQDKVFEPYFSTKSEKNGTGLGLYMSKTIIVEHHYGNIGVSNIKDGVCFKISF